MNILLSGASGFIGRNVANSFIAAGHNVFAFSRDVDATKSAVPGLTDAVVWRPESDTLLEHDLFDADIVINLAGETVNGRWTKRKKLSIQRSRESVTRLLINLMANARKKPKMFISASAIGIYGDRGDEILTESSEIGRGFLASATKAWETEAMKAENIDVQVAILRFGIVLGNYGGALSRMLPIFKLGLGGSLGIGNQWWSWIHMDDIVGIIHHVIQQEMTGIFNSTSPYPVRQKDFSKALASSLRRPAFLPTPELFLKLGLGEFSSELLFSKRVIPEQTLKKGYNFMYPEIENALTNLLVSKKPHQI